MKKKPLKDKDSVAVSLFLKDAFWPLPYLCLFGLVLGSLAGGILGAIFGIIAGVIVSIIVSLISMFISNKFGQAAAFIYKGSGSNWTLQEKMAGDMDQVRYHKMNKKYDQALLKVNDVLAEAPGYADALYLKAGILWEGFNKPIEAKRCLHEIIKTTPKTANCHTWASSLYADITREQRRRLDNKDEDAS